jgi:uncharacterized membrane protein YjgN (DUF898 family)
MDMSPLSPPEKPKAAKLFYIAKTENFMQLGVVSMLFTYLTLGGYYFKAMTELVTYQVNALAFTKTLRLKYSGTPLEYFKAVAPALGGLIIAAGIVQWAVISQSYLIFFVTVIIAFFLVHYGVFAARRYRLSEIRINTTRLKVTTPVVDYMKVLLKRTALNLGTCGYAIPQSDMEKWALFVNTLQVGNTRFTFTGSADSLRWIHMVSFYIPFLLATVFILMAAQVPASAEGQVQLGRSFLIAFFYITLIGGFLGRAWYQAALRAECLRGLRLGSVRFKTTVTGLDLFKTRTLNLVVLVGTLGLGYPFLQHRNLDLWCKTTIIGGNLLSVLTPNPSESSGAHI